MRKDWPWIALAACLGVVIFSYLRVVAGFGRGQMSRSAFWMAGLIVFLMVVLAAQARWKARATDPATDAWSRPLSDDTSRAKILYCCGLVALFTVVITFAAILNPDPANTGSLLPKAAGGIVMARTFLIAARHRNA